MAIFCTVFGVALAQLIISRLSPLGMFDLRSIKRMDYDEYNALKDPRIKKYVVQDRELSSTLITSPLQMQNICKALSAL